MRILQINNFEAISGGSDRVFQLSTRMLLDRGHQISTLSCGEQSFDDRKHSVLLKRNGYLQTSPLATLRNISNFVYREEAAQAVRALVSDFRPQLAHLHIFYGQLSSSVLHTLHAMGVPCVMTVHEYRMLCPVSTLYTEGRGVCERCAHGARRHAILGRCNRNSLLSSGLSALETWFRDRLYPYGRLIDHFFMVSRFCLDKHVQYQPELASKSEVLYNFISDADLAEQAFQPNQGAPFIYCGRLSREKGVGLLCEAFAARPDLQLRIAGVGPLAGELQRKHAGTPNIHFLGRLDAAALKRELRGSWFSIVPSEWYENNPMAILESFGQGTPVLGAQIGGIPELVLTGRTGLLFEPSNLASLQEAIDIASVMTCAQRAAMAAQAMQLIRDRHDETHYYQQLMQGYERVLAARGRATR